MAQVSHTWQCDGDKLQGSRDRVNTCSGYSKACLDIDKFSTAWQNYPYVWNHCRRITFISLAMRYNLRISCVRASVRVCACVIILTATPRHPKNPSSNGEHGFHVYMSPSVPSTSLNLKPDHIKHIHKPKTRPYHTHP
jgi:hypothetical protein